MKLVREYINEKFTEDGDPIKDMGIGVSIIPIKKNKLHHKNENIWEIIFHDSGDEWMIWYFDDNYPLGWGGSHVIIQPDLLKNKYAKKHNFPQNNVYVYKRNNTFLVPKEYKNYIPKEVFDIVFEKTKIKLVFV